MKCILIWWMRRYAMIHAPYVTIPLEAMSFAMTLHSHIDSFADDLYTLARVVYNGRGIMSRSST